MTEEIDCRTNLSSLNKIDFGASDTASFRSVYNFTYLPKVVERAVANQLNDHLATSQHTANVTLIQRKLLCCGYCLTRCLPPIVNG